MKDSISIKLSELFLSRPMIPPFTLPLINHHSSTYRHFIDNVSNFLLNPIVGVFDDVTGPVGEGAPESLDLIRLSYILSYQVFNSRYDLVENELTEDEIFYIGGFSWISDPVLNYYFNFERWWIGCFCTEPSLQEIAAAS